MPPKGSKAARKSPTAAANAPAVTVQSISNTTFLDALVVPDLAHACSRVLSHRMNGTGGGLKQLRSVSQGVKMAAQAAVQGFTLKLGGKAAPVSPELLSFLSKSQIRILRIKVSALAASAVDGQSVATGTQVLAAELNSFVSSTGTALSSVVQLKLTLPHGTGSAEPAAAATAATALTEILLPLATACPQLTCLSITGHAGPAFLQKLGSSCSKLSSLEAVLPHLSTQVLTRLSTLLPHITSLTALPPPAPDRQSTSRKAAQAAANIAAMCTALKLFPDLHTFDAGSVAITEDVWQALPTNLHTLRCCTPANIPLGQWQKRQSLHTLDVRAAGRMSVGPLAMLLLASPNVSVLETYETLVLDAAFSRAAVRNLQSFHDRLEAGLLTRRGAPTATSHGSALRAGPGRLMLIFRAGMSSKAIADVTSELYGFPMSTFLATHMMQPLPRFTDVEFTNEEGDYSWRGDLTHVSRVFPSIKDLTVTNLDLQPSDAQALVKCASLQRLKLETVDFFTGDNLRTLCTNSKSLQSVILYGCRGVSLEEGERIAAEGKGRVAGVEIEIERGSILEDEDEKFEQRQLWSNGNDSSSDGVSSDIHDY